MVSDRSYVAQNDAERQRLKAFVASLADADIARPVGQHWTVAVALVHLAFWDRLWLAKFEEWQRTGTVIMPPADADACQKDINDGMLVWWRTIAPVHARHEVVAAAEAVDSKAEQLDESLVKQIVAVRPRTLIRAIHRREVLNELERVLAG
jgi:uncharacterized damage-inducible protein DinB